MGINQTGYDMTDSNQTTPKSTQCDHSAQALLPWYLSGQLTDDEMAFVAAHLQCCAACAEDYASELALRAAYRDLGEPAALGGKAAWATLQAQLVAPSPRPWRGRVMPMMRRGAATLDRNRRVAAVIGAQAAAICLLIATPASQPNPVPRDASPYRGLSGAPVAANANSIVMFHPDAREAAIRSALTAVGATIVDGPTEGRAYLLRLPSGDQRAMLAKLRRQPAVALAEAVNSDMP